MKSLIFLVPLFIFALSACVGASLEELTPTPGAPSPTTTVAIPTPTPELPDEEFVAFLEDWASQQENYDGISLEYADEKEWEVLVNHSDGSSEHMMVVTDDQAFIYVDGETQEILLEDFYTELVGKFEGLDYVKLFVARNEETAQSSYMWRYPWGGWVLNENKIFTENGVSIVANEAELYGGLFTINPEEVEELWEDTVAAIYYFQVMSWNRAVTGIYPTIDRFIAAARQGREITDLRRPIGYPDGSPGNFWEVAWEEIDEPMNLTMVRFEIEHFSDNTLWRIDVYRDRDYFFHDFFYIQAMSSLVEIGDRSVLSFTLRKSKLTDESGFGEIILRDTLSNDNNLRAATQLIRVFVDKFPRMYDVWNTDPSLIFHSYENTVYFGMGEIVHEERLERSNIENSPLLLVP